MAKTQIADIIVPSIFLPYVYEETATLSAFYQSGIIQRNGELDALASGAGKTFNMPFWQDLTGNSEVISDSATLTAAKIGASQDVAIAHNRAKAWSSTLLAGLLGGSDPMQAVARFVAKWWARDQQTMLIATLKGIFADNAANDSGDLISSILSESIASTTDATRLRAETFYTALNKLGDASDKVTAVAMHSAVHTSLLKADLIDFVPDSEGKTQIATFCGRRVIVDDGMPTRAGSTDGVVYRTYLFAQGAVGMGIDTGFGAQPLPGGFGTQGLEFYRVPLGHDEGMINRMRFICHVRGIKWAGGSLAGASPTNTELEDATNWNRVYEKKNIGVIAIDHNA